MEWYQENDAGEREGVLYVRYSQDSNSKTSKMKLYNNDKYLMDIDFEATGSVGSSWQDKVVLIPLISGANYLRLESASATSPSIDQVYVE